MDIVKLMTHDDRAGIAKRNPVEYVEYRYQVAGIGVLLANRSWSWVVGSRFFCRDCTKLWGFIRCGIQLPTLQVKCSRGIVHDGTKRERTIDYVVWIAIMYVATNE
jgi:hypothetical protein